MLPLLLRLALEEVSCSQQRCDLGALAIGAEVQVQKYVPGSDRLWRITDQHRRNACVGAAGLMVFAHCINGLVEAGDLLAPAVNQHQKIALSPWLFVVA